MRRFEPLTNGFDVLAPDSGAPVSGSSSAAKQAKLKIIAPPVTEVAVVDSELQPAASGVGDLALDVRPGIYRVRATSGDVTLEEYRVLAPGEESVVEFRAEDLAFRSIVPLANTRSLDAEHAKVARQFSRAAPAVSRGTGARLFVMARGRSSRGFDPATELSLLSADGSATVVDFAQNGSRSVDRRHPWAVCHVELDPGVYLLRVGFESGPDSDYRAVDAGRRGAAQLADPGVSTATPVRRPRRRAPRGPGGRSDPSRAAQL